MTCTDVVCGIGGWGGPLPGDPDNNVALSATTVFGGIEVSWSYPGTNPHAVAHTLLYRGTRDAFEAAVAFPPVGGSMFYDKLNPAADTTYYYWIQIVSANGTVGARIGPVSAVAKPLGEQALASLSGRIDDSVLAQALRSKIDIIAPLGRDLVQEVQNRLASNVALKDAFLAVQSESGEAMTYLRQEVTQRKTADSAMVTQLNVMSVGLAGNAAALVQETQVRVTREEAVALKLTTMVSRFATNEAALITEQTARSTADQATATSLAQLVTKTDNNAAAISSEQSTRTTADSALASSISQLQSKTSSNTADITQEQRTRTTETQALATDVRQLYTHTSNLSASITNEQLVRAGATDALARQVTTVQTTLSGNLVSVETGLKASIDSTNGKVTQIGAQWTAKVSVNGMVGGFGVYNDGREVQAGFDVDKFWIGRTNTSAVAPFIVTNGLVHIDQARIRDADIGTLKIAGTAVTVPAYVANNGSDISLVYTLTGEPGATYSVFILVGLTSNAATIERFSINGVDQWYESVAQGTILSKGIVVPLAPGTYTFRAWMDNTSNTGASIYALATKR